MFKTKNEKKKDIYLLGVSCYINLEEVQLCYHIYNQTEETLV